MKTEATPTHAENGLPLVTDELITSFGREEQSLAVRAVMCKLFGKEELPDIGDVLGITFERLAKEQEPLADYINAVIAGIPRVSEISKGNTETVMYYVSVSMLRMYRLLELAEENARKG